MSSYDWVPCHNFQLPPNAVTCGRDLDNSDIYVGQAFHEGDEIPCKIVPRRREAYVSYNGNEVQVNHFKVLIEKKMCWIAERDGRVPPGAVSGGRTKSGETLYIARTRTSNVTVLGKVHPSHRCLYYPYAGKEVASKQYEVLCCR